MEDWSPAALRDVAENGSLNSTNTGPRQKMTKAREKKRSKLIQISWIWIIWRVQFPEIHTLLITSGEASKCIPKLLCLCRVHVQSLAAKCKAEKLGHCWHYWPNHPGLQYLDDKYLQDFPPHKIRSRLCLVAQLQHHHKTSQVAKTHEPHRTSSSFLPMLLYPIWEPRIEVARPYGMQITHQIIDVRSPIKAFVGDYSKADRLGQTLKTSSITLGQFDEKIWCPFCIGSYRLVIFATMQLQVA